MKKAYWLIGLTIIGVFSCKKWKYDQVRIHGQVINGTLGQPMPGEQVSLIEVKDEFLGPGNSKTIKTVTTNANGEYDFGGMDLRKKDKFDYFITYVHRGITTQGFCDSYEVDKHSIDQNKNLVVFVGSALVFKIVPDMSIIPPGDSITITVQTSADFSNFYCNPNAVEDYAYKKSAIYSNGSFSLDGRSNPMPGGDACYYLKIRKLKSGVEEITYDTVLLHEQSIEYSINW